MTTVALNTNILFVDDEEFVLRSLRRLFGTLYNVFTASSGRDALEIVRKNAIHVVVCDQRMPGMIGVEVLRAVKDISPATMRVLLTGYSDMTAIVNSINEGEIFRYILKPWNNDELKKTVQYATEIACETLGKNAPQGAAQASKTALASSSAAMLATATPVDILVVDNDKSVYKLIKDAYDSAGKIYYASDTEQALRALETHDNIGVLVSDIKVNGEIVTEMVSALKLHYPLLTTVITTSLSDSELLRQLVNQCQVFRFIVKPPSAALLHSVMQAALDKHHELKNNPTLLKRHTVEVTDTDSQVFNRVRTLGSRLKTRLRSLFGF